MRTALPTKILILLAAALGSAAAARQPAVSWGKPGISYEAYRADATACLREAARTDLSGTEPAEALILASRRIESALNTDPWSVAEATDAARPDLRIRQARDIMQALRDKNIKHSESTIPCGHYTLGEKPWVYLDAFKIVSFLRKSLK